MELLQAEISRKRSRNEALRSAGEGGSEEPGTKHIRQSMAMQAASEDLLGQQRELEAVQEKEREETQDSKATVEVIVKEVAVDAHKDTETGPPPRGQLWVEVNALDDEDLTSRLRGAGEPISLFGENESMKKTRLIAALSKAQHGEQKQKITPRPMKAASPRREKEEEEDVGVCTHYSDDLERMGAEKVIYKYFKNLVKQWEKDLEGLSAQEAKSARGRAERSSQKNAKEHIKALFDLCKHKEIPPDIKNQLLQMVTHCEQGNFRVAHDHYLQAAIGKAAWPIGVTSVGIHQRSGRERLNESKVAHVMNNEMQRKYFTSVKRLMTYAQSKRPDVAPSMKVL